MSNSLPKLHALILERNNNQLAQSRFPYQKSFSTRAISYSKFLFDLVAGDDHHLPCRISFTRGCIRLLANRICHTAVFRYQFLGFPQLFRKYADQFVVPTLNIRS